MANPEILPDLFFVQRGYLNGNHFVYRADRPVLIDTAYLGHFDRTRATLIARPQRRRCLQTSLDPARPLNRLLSCGGSGLPPTLRCGRGCLRTHFPSRSAIGVS